MNKIMNKYLEQVQKFHKSFNHPIEENIIKEGNYKLRVLRLKLLFEEIEELSNAMATDEVFHELCSNALSKPQNNILYDQVETLDALCDLQYVLSGASIAMGYKNVFDDAFDEVQRSNMSKLCSTMYEAEETIKYYRDERKEQLGIEVVQKGSDYIIVREDDKILKNKYYSPADLKQFID